MMAATTKHPGARDFDIEVFYDGACPLCLREIRMLQVRDSRSRIVFTDIAAEEFDARAIGRSQAELMRRIHGRLPDGRLIVGVEVFRRLYSAIGFAPLVWLTRLPIVSQLLDLGYELFAKYRLRLTGRCTEESCSLPGSATEAASR